ncbi:MAG: hypothetical protein ACKOBM_17465, partial [Gammaproteobacteria bacterium]
HPQGRVDAALTGRRPRHEGAGAKRPVAGQMYVRICPATASSFRRPRVALADIFPHAKCPQNHPSG